MHPGTRIHPPHCCAVGPSLSRRRERGLGALSEALLTASRSPGQMAAGGRMADLKLTFACDNYLHTKALRDGTVRPEGIELIYLSTFPAETFQRMVQFREFDACEMGMKFYASTFLTEERPFVAIPCLPVALVPPCRDLCQREEPYPRAQGPDRPEDRRAVRLWARRRDLGARHHERRIWRAHRQRHLLCRAARQEHGARVRTLPAAPAYQGRRDRARPDARRDARNRRDRRALFRHRAAVALEAQRQGAAPSSTDYKQVERAYFAATGIFPIMHTTVVRRDLYEQNRWVAQSAVQGAEGGEAARLRPLPLGRAQYAPADDGALADRASRGESPGLGRGLLALRARAQPHRDRRLPALSPRAGIVAAAPVVPDELFAPETLVDYFPYKPPS